MLKYTNEGQKKQHCVRLCIDNNAGLAYLHGEENWLRSIGASVILKFIRGKVTKRGLLGRLSRNIHYGWFEWANLSHAMNNEASQDYYDRPQQELDDNTSVHTVGNRAGKTEDKERAMTSILVSLHSLRSFLYIWWRDDANFR